MGGNHRSVTFYFKKLEEGPGQVPQMGGVSFQKIAFQKIVESIPSQGTQPGLQVQSMVGAHMGGNWMMFLFHTDIFFLSLSN